MPQQAAYILTWSKNDQRYEFITTLQQTTIALTLERPLGALLEEITSFTFRGKQGSFTAHREKRKPEIGYWYAYRRHKGKLKKRYLGRTSDLHIDLLETAAWHLIPPSNNTNTTRPTQLPSPTPLLMTKLAPPRLRSQIILRPTLFERLTSALQGCCTLLSAPAGSGKSTLLAYWCIQQQRKAVWLALDTEENDPVRFLSYLIAALRTLDERIGEQAMARFFASQHAGTTHALEAACTVLLNDLTTYLTETRVLILEDYHVITTSSIHQALQLFIERSPALLHVVICTRSDPPISLHRLRVRGQLTELRGSDLRFSATEIQSFCETTMGLKLDTDTIAAIAQQTEGWIAGVQLITLSLSHTSQTTLLPTIKPDNQQEILHYLSIEVLEQQPAEIQEFLLHTCILEYFTGEMCDTITQKEQSQAIIDSLKQRNLFLIELHGQNKHGSSYRYHHLFAELLRREAERRDPEHFLELHRRACNWYASQQLPDRAIEHALSARDFPQALALIEQIASATFQQGAWRTLYRWLNAIPQQILFTSLTCAVFYAWCQLWTQQPPQQLEETLKHMETYSSSREMRGHIAAIRGSQAMMETNFALAKIYLQQALTDLPDDQDIAALRSVLNNSLSLIHLKQGNLTEANKLTSHASEQLSQTHESITMDAIDALALQAQVQVQRGQLLQAYALYQQLFTQAQQYQLRPNGFTCIQFANLLYQWNELEQAYQYVQQGIDYYTQEFETLHIQICLGYELRARIELAQRLAQKVLISLQKLENIALTAQNPRIYATASLYQTTIHLMRNDQESAWQTLQRYKALISEEKDLDTRCLFVSILLYQGNLNEAECILEEALQQAQDSGQLHRCIALLVQQTRLLHLQGNSGQALNILRHTLEIAQPGGYLRVFVDSDQQIGQLLENLCMNMSDRQGTLKAYLERILAACNRQVKTLKTLEYPLTARELEILALLSDGFSDREIAEKLVITVGTVKTYLRSIYSKLAVGNRTRAVKRAKDLALIS